MIKYLQINKLLLAFLITFINVSSVTTLYAQYPEGTIHGIFSVSDSTYVIFSQGNLQYIGSASTPYWKFADNQWEYFGTNTGQGSSDQNKDRDLFGWGTSGYNHGATCYQPWSTSTTDSHYYAYGSSNYNLFNGTGQADWGYNAISNGGNLENSDWRTLTRGEWKYVFNTRSTPSGILYAKATVNNVNGVILLPDDWNDSYYSLRSSNLPGSSYTQNTITSLQWNTLEQHGAVFLPAAGCRDGISVINVGASGYYWSASYGSSSGAYGVCCNGSKLETNGYYRSRGFSVRLVRPAQTASFSINATPNPAEGGAVSGAGIYSGGAVCTLTAMPSAGYAFAFWSEAGIVVSTNASYIFTVLRSRNLVANFVSEEYITFADANVKALCVANWDANGDGELSYVEAAGVTNLGNVFKNNTSIHSFNELQHFVLLGSIGEQAFYGCTELTQITIPEQVTIVGGKAFWNCPALQTVTFNAVNCTSMQTTYNSNTTYSVFSSDVSGGASALTRVVIGSNVQRIPDYAFKGSVDIYQRLVIPASVAEIGKHAFDGCNSLVQMVIQGNGLLTIGEYAFNGCSALRSALNLPNSVTSIGQYAFYGCENLPSVTIGTGVETVGGFAFWNCPNLATVHFNATNCATMYSVFNSGTDGSGATPITTLSIGNTVTRIPDYAFNDSPGITHAITIPNATTYIGQYAFHSIQSAELTIGTGVTEIGGYAFWNCPNLATVHFNATNCTTMETRYKIYQDHYGYWSVFNSGSGTSSYYDTTPIITLTIGENVTNIPNYSFYMSSNITGDLILPDGLSNIGKSAFGGCGGFTGDLSIPNSVVTLGEGAFSGCSGFNGILTLPVNDSFTIINPYTFSGCSSLTGALAIPANVTEVSEYAFYNCSSFTDALVLHDAMTTIGEYAFFGCSNISELTIGEDISTIIGSAFGACPGLVTVHFNATNCTSMDGIFTHNVSNIPSVTAIGTLTIGENVTNIPDNAFLNCSAITGDLVLPNGLSNIGQYAFDGCSGFTGDLIIPNLVTTLGQYAFRNCSGFTGDLVIPNSVTTLGQYAFRGCSGFDGSLVIGSGVQTINNATFENCSGFQGSLIVGRQVNSIGSNAFKNCNGFSVLISENPTPPTASSNSFQSMNFSIPAYVPYAMIPDYQSAAGWSQFTNYVEQCVFDQLDNDLWSDETNWYAFELSGPNDVVCVNSNCHLDMDAEVLHIYVLNLNDVLTVNSGNTLNTNYGIGILQPSQLVLQEGSQLINNLPGLHGTMQRQIPGYGSGNGGWFTVSAPIYRGASVSPLTTGSYDLYAYDEPTAMWLNQRDEATALESFIPGHGYLYAHQDGFAMQLAGQLNPSNADISVPVTCQHGLLPGFNLLGNPYTNNININSVKFNNTPITSYYKAVGGSQLVAYTDADNDAIQPIEGFFVQVPADGTVYFNTPSREEQGSYIRLVLNKDEKMLDRAYLRMNDGATLNKAFVEGHPSLLYLSVDGQPYAVAPQGRQAYNLCFVPVEEGSFVIECNLLHTECDYLHLIDTFTGEEVDLLATPSYSFKASAHDSQNRFALVLSADALPVEATANHRNRDAVPVLPSHGSNTSQYGYSSNAVVINATANPAEGGTVTGAGTYANGSTVTLTATANEGYTFVNWTENGNVVSTNATYTFVVNEGRTLVANFNQNSSEITHTTALTNGWNWWSTYIELNGNDGLAQLENSLGSHGMMIKSRENGFVEPYNVNGTISWYGILTSICNEQMYMIRTDAACQATVTGQAASPANHSVTLNPGWNWIGFMGQQPVSVGAAMSGVTPEGNDVVKGRNSYATYYAGDGNWYGTLNTLEPGQGYMYQSNSNAAQTLTYNTGRAGDTGVNLTPEHNVFRPAADNHAHNMTVTAVVEADGAELRSGLYELAAFVGDDCRGSVKLIHVEALDRYVAFLTVFGEPDEPLAFRLTDGTATALAAETMAFSIDGTRGSLTNPCVLRFGSLSVEDMSLPQVSVYPNPSDGVFCVEGRDIERVEAYNTLGQLVLRQETHADRLKVDLSSRAHGVYTLRVVTTQGVSLHTVITK